MRSPKVNMCLRLLLGKARGQQKREKSVVLIDDRSLKDVLLFARRFTRLLAVKTFFVHCLLLACTLAVQTPLAIAQRETAADKDAIPPPLQFYKGRRIAPTMSYSGAEWLLRESRQSEENCSLMLAELGLKPGMTVCDMGCGNGFYALQMAKLVGPQGKVLSVDVQTKMLKFLEERAADAGITNIVPILGDLHDPKLPTGKVDLILCSDVYHEFSHPEHMLRAMRRSLSADGVLVLLEFRTEDPLVPIKTLHKMSKAQILKELLPNGFKLVKEFDGLPWQHMMFFGCNDRKPAGQPPASSSDP